MTNRYNNRRQYFDELARTSKEYLSEYIRSYKGLSPGSLVLEIGCGEGGNLVPFAEIGCKVCGIDISTGKIDNARRFFREKGLDGEFICSDFVRCEIEQYVGRYDIIIIHDVIEHIDPEDKDEFMSRAKALLRPSGGDHGSFSSVEDAFWRTSADMQKPTLPSAVHTPSSRKMV